MKICFVAPANNYHTKKWANWFISRGHEVHIITFIEDLIPGATVHYINTGANSEDGNLKKLKYLFAGKKINRLLKSINPDIVNVHYATSYGTAMALSGYHPYILSVWGADIYDFPQEGFFQKEMVKFSLKNADWLYSTSKAMAKESKKYTNKEFTITPFGVDMSLFSPNKRTRDNDGKFIVGTVKALTPKYGIDTLLKGVARVYKAHPEYNLEVRIAGKGESEKTLKALAKQLGISEIVKWLGFISQEDAAKEWANMDVGVVASSMLSESFGVSAIECQASGTPVIISDVPGLEEATNPGKSSIVIPIKDDNALSEKIIELHDDLKLRIEIGNEGRKFVVENYELNKCFLEVESNMESKIVQHNIYLGGYKEVICLYNYVIPAGDILMEVA